MAGKPFVLLGINTNGYPVAQLKQVMDKEQLTWRSFADHTQAGRGPICAQWGLMGTPTLYVLDHKGVIRYKWLGSPGTKAIDDALATLIAEAQKDSKK
jgi:hypothetical protein